MFATNRDRPAKWLLTLALLPLFLGATCGLPGTDRPPGRAFATPEAAVEALLRAMEAHDPEALLAVVGETYRREVVTDDWEAARRANRFVAERARQKHELVPQDDGSLELVIGAVGWPFPARLVRTRTRPSFRAAWAFDIESGLEEVLDRRIGRNELTAIAISRAYVDAQIEYAREDRNGDGYLEYAQKLSSTPGKRDGLYWYADDGAAASPFGALVEASEAYLETLDRGSAVRGYRFEVLERQGAHAPGGAYEYVKAGRMVAGFALVAYPADPGITGVMTFVTSHHGQVFQKDLGPDARGVDSYDPDDSWSAVGAQAAITR